MSPSSDSESETETGTEYYLLSKLNEGLIILFDFRGDIKLVLKCFLDTDLGLNELGEKYRLDLSLGKPGPGELRLGNLLSSPVNVV